MNAAKQLFDAGQPDEISGVRPAVDVACLIQSDEGPDPAPVYFELLGRRFFLGVRFPNGIIAAAGWDTDMDDAGVPACLVEGTRRWLVDRTF